jgi:hypothetical protein
LRFADGFALVIERAPRGVSAVLREVADPGAVRSRERPTRRQSEYLDFNRRYIVRYGVSPAESDIQQHSIRVVVD